MGNFTKTLVCVVSVIFAVLAFGVFISGGSGKESIPFLVVSAVVALFGGIGLFFQRFPPPPISPGEGNSAWALFNSYRKHYPGWQGKLVCYGIPSLMLIVLLFRLRTLLPSI